MADVIVVDERVVGGGKLRDRVVVGMQPSGNGWRIYWKPLMDRDYKVFPRSVALPREVAEHHAKALGAALLDYAYACVHQMEQAEKQP